ncbi:hypothetical protein E5676_scaffold113G001490 [Cucumis melo var. makuwa]|uniref:DUF659 domain-containing protein n=2 Tax=Cucumis melo TaxID=3656 RepID=A0A5A7UDR2_CUCMM|nr:hypothetical protein E6C27_scaffold207G001630 [Cucumis melo var. makuwa]TYK01886.1 hypothetical protein E5676_scaffold113G001490 [Cucumis melo var. makuwa]
MAKALPRQPARCNMKGYSHKGKERKYSKTDGHKFKVPKLGPIQQASQCRYGDYITQVHVLYLSSVLKGAPRRKAHPLRLFVERRGDDEEARLRHAPSSRRSRKCPDHVKEEIKDCMSKKKEIKEQRNLIVDIDVQDYGIEDEDEGSISVNNRATSNGSSLKRPRQKGPMDAFFTPNPETVVHNRKNDKGKQTSLNAAFAPMIESIGQFGPGLKPPTYHELRVPCLKKELEAKNELMRSHKAEWAKVGCTVMADGWTDRRNRTLINFLVNSPKGTMFIESIDASSYVKDEKKMFELLDNFVERIGEANVVQVVTDNASANVMAGRFLEAKRPQLIWSPCAAHCLDLMLEDIYKISNIRKALKRGMKISNFIYVRPGLLNMMRRFTNQKELVRPVKTRFATACITLSSIHPQKNNLRKMFTSDEWKDSKWSKEQQGRRVVHTILLTSFWTTIVFALKVSGPLVRVLKLVDDEKKPPMGFIYEAMDRAKEAIAKSFNNNEEKYKDISTIIDRRWELQLLRPLHAAGYYLIPSFYYSNPSIQEDDEIVNGLYSCITKMVASLDVQDKILAELSKYKRAEALFGQPLAIRQRDKISPGKFQLTDYASGCECNWSVFEQVNFPLLYMRILDDDSEEEDELVFDDDTLTWGDVSRAAGAKEPTFYSRARALGATNSRSAVERKRDGDDCERYGSRAVQSRSAVEKNHPATNGLLNKSFPDYDELSYAFGKDYAIGTHAETFADVRSNVSDVYEGFPLEDGNDMEILTMYSLGLNMSPKDIMDAQPRRSSDCYRG